MILIFAFVFILAITFAVMAIVTRPSTAQKAIERRVDDIKSSGVSTTAASSEIGQLLKTESASDFRWLEDLLEKYKLSRSIGLRILQANSKTTVGKLLVSSAGLALGALVVSYLFMPAIAINVVAACLFAYIPYGVLSFKRSRRIAKFNAGLPDAIDMMGRALRAGHSMIASINIVAEQSVEPVKSEFAEVFKQQNFGLPLRDALLQMLDHVPSQDLRVLVTGILVQRETGGNLAEILDRTVLVIRERLRIHGEIKTHTAQGRMTGWILCALPIIMLVLINITNPGYSKVLLETPLGHKLMYIGIALLSLGGFIIQKIVNGIEV